MIGMLRRGNTGDQLMQILDLIISERRTQVCEDEGLADCPENEEEIQSALAAV